MKNNQSNAESQNYLKRQWKKPRFEELKINLAFNLEKHLQHIVLVTHYLNIKGKEYPLSLPYLSKFYNQCTSITLFTVNILVQK